MMKKTDVPNNVKWAAEGKKILEYVPDYITIEGWNMMKSAGEDNSSQISPFSNEFSLSGQFQYNALADFFPDVHGKVI